MMNAWAKVRAAPEIHCVDYGSLDLPYRTLPRAAVALRRAADAAQRAADVACREEASKRRAAARKKYDGRFANGALFAALRSFKAPGLAFLWSAAGDMLTKPADVEGEVNRVWSGIFDAEPEEQRQSAVSFLGDFGQFYPEAPEFEIGDITAADLREAATAGRASSADFR